MVSYPSLCTSVLLPTIKGTAAAHWVLCTLDNQAFRFIDTPGFGSSVGDSKILKSSVQKTLGYFTRTLGGIHGILYVQSILDVCTTPSMSESLQFLSELYPTAFYPHITFTTTKWDVPKRIDSYRRREEELKEGLWKDFRISSGGARYFQHVGIDCDEASSDERETARAPLISNGLRYYFDSWVAGLVMPFSQWTTAGQVGFAVDKGVKGVIVAIGIGFLHAFSSLHLSSGLRLTSLKLL